MHVGTIGISQMETCVIEKLEIRNDVSAQDAALIQDYISNRSYWGRGRTLAQVEASIRQSICFGAYYGEQLAGFTRAVSDTVTFAYVLDLFVLEEFRGRGISKKLVEAMLAHKELQTVNWLLGTNDAHGLYEQYGFSTVEASGRYMGRKSARNNNEI